MFLLQCKGDLLSKSYRVLPLIQIYVLILGAKKIHMPFCKYFQRSVWNSAQRLERKEPTR